jgi:methylated-DNA-[protein]-cysteine S-methyltransferase
MMGQTTHRYLIFETASGFCGTAWNGVGVTCLQLPTKSAEAAERAVRRRAPGAVPGAPTPAIAEAVAAVKRYFEGEETDFSGFKLDLDEQGAFFEQVYPAARRVGWGHTTTYGALAKELGAGTEAARDVGQAMARNPVPLIIPCHRVLAAGGKIGGFPRQAARPPSFACSSSRAFMSSGRDRYSRPKARRSSNGALQRDKPETR